MAAPRPVEERRLVDDVGAGAHRRLGGRGGLPEPVAIARRRAIALDRHDAPSRGAQVVEVALLVRDAPLRDELDRRVVADGLLDEPGQRRALERQAMRAREEPDEVGRGVDRPAVDQLHG